MVATRAEEPSPPPPRQTWVWPPQDYQAAVTADQEEFKIDLQISAGWFPFWNASPPGAAEGNLASKAAPLSPVPTLSLVANAATAQELRLILVPGEPEANPLVRSVKLAGKTVGRLECPGNETRTARFRIPRALLKPLGDSFQIMIDRPLLGLVGAEGKQVGTLPDVGSWSFAVMNTFEGRFATYTAPAPVTLSAKLRERKPKTYAEALDAFGPAFIPLLSGLGDWEWHFEDKIYYRVSGPHEGHGRGLQQEIELKTAEEYFLEIKIPHSDSAPAKEGLGPGVPVLPR